MKIFFIKLQIFGSFARRFKQLFLISFFMMDMFAAMKDYSLQLMSMRRYKDAILAPCRDTLIKRNGIEPLYPDNGRCPLLSRGICHTSIPRGNTSMCHVFNELMSRGKHQSITNQVI